MDISGGIIGIRSSSHRPSKMA